MTSRDASLSLYKQVDKCGNTGEFNLNEAWDCYKIIKQDLDRLEESEKTRIKYFKLCLEYQGKYQNVLIQNLKYKNKLEKLEKTFEILKDKFFIDLIERHEDGKLGFAPINQIENQPRFAELNKEEYNLLKEVFEGE